MKIQLLSFLLMILLLANCAEKKPASDAPAASTDSTESVMAPSLVQPFHPLVKSPRRKYLTTIGKLLGLTILKP